MSFCVCFIFRFCCFCRRVRQVLLLSSFCCLTHRFYVFQFPWFLTFIVVKIVLMFNGLIIEETLFGVNAS